MAQMILLVLNDVEKSAELLDAWQAVGVAGATVINSTGLGHLHQAGLQDDMPLMPSLSDFFRVDEVYHRMFFTVVNDDTLIEPIIEATQRVTGDLTQPHTGMLVILPITRVIGAR